MIYDGVDKLRRTAADISGSVDRSKDHASEMDPLADSISQLKDQLKDTIAHLDTVDSIKPCIGISYSNLTCSEVLGIYL